MAAELLDLYEMDIESLTLIPSDGGRYEITVNDTLLYSKHANNRHAEPGEVARLIGEFLETAQKTTKK